MSKYGFSWSTRITISAHEKFQIGPHLPRYIEDLIAEEYSKLSKVITGDSTYELNWTYVGVPITGTTTSFSFASWKDIPDNVNSELTLTVREVRCE